jgi:hypothetical protein
VGCPFYPVPGFRFYADFTGVDPRYRAPPPPPDEDDCDCPSGGAAPAWEAEPEPLRPAP